MRTANILTFIVGCLWLALFVTGRGLAYGVYSQRVLGYPNAGQIDYYILFPICVVAILMLIAWACNVFYRPPARLWSSILLVCSILSFGTLFLYLLPYTGGV